MDEWTKLKTGMRLIIPKNIENLDQETRNKVEEAIYRLQIMHNHGFLEGEYEKLSRRDNEHNHD